MKTSAQRAGSTKGGESVASAVRTPHATVQAQATSPAQRQILDSPRLAAQRARIEATFGPAIQREALPDEEELQMKALPGALQRMGMEEEEPLQGRFHDAPLQGQFVEEEEPLQARRDDGAAASTTTPAAAPPNRTGMPDDLKTGIESLSGLSMDHVRVHYDSPQPAQVQAHAYAQGSNIHLASGQERHLPHEAWHVVQQAQGRVQPTIQAQGVAINDDRGLEHEADVMGAKALQMRSRRLR